jgi:3'(2'), 5'-bisphosphate nucleotidase
MQPAQTPLSELSQIARAVVPIARDAGAVILELYTSGLRPRVKHDGSPVTIADEHAEALILSGLARLAPDIAAVSEEASARGERCSGGDRFWLVDPLDGTKEFLNHTGEFTVNIALVERARPVLGLVLAPALGELYVGLPGRGAWIHRNGTWLPMSARPEPAQGLTILCSRSHGDPAALRRYLADLPVVANRSAGSSLKFCFVAAGKADLYPRFGRTMEWDTAAAHAVLDAAGGAVTDIAGRDLLYGKPGFENPWFIARGKAPRRAPPTLARS